MSLTLDRHRVVLACDEPDRWVLRGLFEHAAFGGWELLEANSIERARYVLQHDHCDVLVIDGDLCRDGADSELSWIATPTMAPVLLLGEADAGQIALALRQGIGQWLPRDLVLLHPELLAAALQRLAATNGERRRLSASQAALGEARRQVSRVVGLLWDASASGSRRPWLPQRLLLERLDEEVTRSKRHGTPLAVVMADIAPHPIAAAHGAESLDEWAIDQVLQSKRRSDLAGQYGLHGFLLVLPHTNEAGAEHYCQRLRAQLREAPGSWPVESRFGVVGLSTEANSLKGLLRRAEQRLDANRMVPA